MKQISTGAGLVALSVGMVATAFIVSQRGGSEAFAQGTGTERRIVAAGVYGTNPLVAYRIWSDNAVDIRALKWLQNYSNWDSNPQIHRWIDIVTHGATPHEWQTFDNGTSGFRPITDVDMSGETDAGDISQVLLDFNTSSNDLPPPPIDCNINAPR
jgi:hypothetical protein